MLDTSDIDKLADSWSRGLITYLNQLDAIQIEVKKHFPENWQENERPKPQEKPKTQQLDLFTWRLK